MTHKIPKIKFLTCTIYTTQYSIHYRRKNKGEHTRWIILYNIHYVCIGFAIRSFPISMELELFHFSMAECCSERWNHCRGDLRGSRDFADYSIIWWRVTTYNSQRYRRYPNIDALNYLSSLTNLLYFVYYATLAGLKKIIICKLRSPTNRLMHFDDVVIIIIFIF